MKITTNCTRFVSLVLALCFLLLPVPAQSVVLADSNALAYEKALQMLTTSSLTDSQKLEDIRAQFVQAGSYQLGIDYKIIVEALILLQSDDEDRFDKALDSVSRLSNLETFTVDYNSHLDKSGKQILPDLGMLIQYIRGRKMEAYGDKEAAIALYEAYSTLDAVSRAGELTNAIRKEKYDKAIGLLTKGSLLSVQQAKELFEELVDYRDSAHRLKESLIRISELATPEPTLTPSPKPTLKPTATPTMKPTATPTMSPTPTPIPVLIVPIAYVDEEGATLYTDYATYTPGTYTYHANDAYLLAGYKLMGSRSVSITVRKDGKVTPSDIRFIYSKPVAVGSIISFGRYEQDNNLSNGPEPIEWQVLAVEEEKVLLISDKCLDCKPYHIVSAPATWANCTLRNWLNNSFFSSAFSNREQKVIVHSFIRNLAVESFGFPKGEDTYDYVFLLSYHDTETYPVYMQSRATSYAVTQGASLDSYWWLRSSVVSGSSLDVTGYNGLVGTGLSSINTVGVRPALWVNLDSGIF